MKLTFKCTLHSVIQQKRLHMHVTIFFNTPHNNKTQTPVKIT